MDKLCGALILLASSTPRIVLALVALAFAARTGVFAIGGESSAGAASSALSLLVPAFVVVALMFYISTRAVAVTVSRDQLSVSGGIFRNEIRLKDVEHVSLEPALPAVQERVNAFTFGDSLRGRYLLEDVGAAHLFVERGSPPYVKVRTTTNVVWINFRDPGRTRDLYATLIGTGALSR